MDRNGFMRCYHCITDDALQLLPGSLFSVFFYVYRETLGWNRFTEKIPVARFVRETGLERTCVLDSIAKLEAGRWIHVMREFTDGGRPYNVYSLGERIWLTDQSEMRTNMLPVRNSNQSEMRTNTSTDSVPKRAKTSTESVPSEKYRSKDKERQTTTRARVRETRQVKGTLEEKSDQEIRDLRETYIYYGYTAWKFENELTKYGFEHMNKCAEARIDREEAGFVPDDPEAYMASIVYNKWMEGGNG